jgi:hypothetical protein
VPSREKFAMQMLKKGDILVIANAEATEAPGPGGESNSAFSEAECNAVRDWVKEGGALLLITDHEPFGSASEALARRFGVQMSKATVSDPSHSDGGSA